MDDHGFLTKITRSKNAVTDELWIKNFLKQAPWGILATAVNRYDQQTIQPFLTPLIFVYDDEIHAIYLHAARAGRLWENHLSNPYVCFNASLMGRLLPAKQALHFDVEYASVVVFGKIVLIDDPVEAEVGLQKLLDKYFSDLKPGIDYEPITENEKKSTAVYRIDISEWSAKQRKASNDFPNARSWVTDI